MPLTNITTTTSTVNINESDQTDPPRGGTRRNGRELIARKRRIPAIGISWEPIALKVSQSSMKFYLSNSASQTLHEFCRFSKVWTSFRKGVVINLFICSLSFVYILYIVLYNNNNDNIAYLQNRHSAKLSLHCNISYGPYQCRIVSGEFIYII